MASKHIIEQVRWEVTITDSEEDLLGQDQLSNYLKSKLLPRLEQVLDRLDPSDCVLSIQKLEINLDLTYKSGWDLDFEWEFERELDKKLQYLLWEGKRSNSSQIQRISFPDYKTQRLALFLEFGISDQDPLDLVKDTLEIDDAANSKMLGLLLEREEVRDRIIRQAGPEFLDEMIKKWSREELTLNFSKHNLIPDEIVDDNFATQRFEQMLNDFATSEPIFYSEIILKLENFYLEKGIVMQKARKNSRNVLQKLLTLEEIIQANPSTKKILIEKQVMRILAGGYFLSENPKAENSPYLPQSLPENIYVSNAGIILIWPFLSHYFNVLGLLDEKQRFISLDHQKRAVQLLHFLCTGQMETSEEYLVLNKLVCALPFESSVDRNFILSEAEKEWTNKLFEVLRQRWGQIQSSSNDNIRGSFLLRKGRLKKKKNKRDWDLIVEGKSYDILLESLSWNISLLRLPWMEHVLYVSWH